MKIYRDMPESMELNLASASRYADSRKEALVHLAYLAQQRMRLQEQLTAKAISDLRRRLIPDNCIIKSEMLENDKLINNMFLEIILPKQMSLESSISLEDKGSTQAPYRERTIAHSITQRAEATQEKQGIDVIFEEEEDKRALGRARFYATVYPSSLTGNYPVCASFQLN